MDHFKKNESWKIFDRISKSYDRTNRIISLGQDMRWRSQLVKALPKLAALDILDLATGTGDQAISFLKAGAPIQSITGIDLSKEMLAIAKEKVPSMECLVADAMQLPLSDESFDVASFSFGIRNVENPLVALQEIHRVLKPKGRALILEFSLPNPVIRPFYFLYLRHILPKLGAYFSKDPDAYRYLNKTIEVFPSGKAFCRLMEQAKLKNCRVKTMNFGTVSLYIGEKS